MSLDTMKLFVREQHDNGTGMQRFGTEGDPRHGGCFYSGSSCMVIAKAQHNPFFYLVSHGDGPLYSFSEITKVEERIKKARSENWDFLKYKSTSRSRKWYEFLMSSESPWRALHPFIAEKDLDFINDAGVIFQDLPSLPSRLFYNFQMAIRFPWEIPTLFSLYELLVEKGIPKTEALYIANSAELLEEAKNLDGPWVLQYPWSYLEGMTFEAAGRFILGQPWDLSPTSNPSEKNVTNLWSGKWAGKWQNETDKMVEQKFSLPDLRAIIASAVEDQKGQM